ncbi:MAG: hypothetical protein IT427_13930 [Pirellulales bacterium]|nr:hypothetical protein [Pirellulales bacterium]
MRHITRFRAIGVEPSLLLYPPQVDLPSEAPVASLERFENDAAAMATVLFAFNPSFDDSIATLPINKLFNVYRASE